MRYIESVHIKNFQSYKNETIHFKPGLNLLLGSSDSGKSAILRAISFVLYNYPSSNTVIHNGEKEAEVSVKFSDGTIVTRIRGERNAYLATDKDGKKYSCNKIDKAIPEEIKKLLNYPPEDKFNGFISYADQFSSMFLVDLSSSDLPRSLSHLTGIEMLEECAKQLMQNYKQIDKQIKAQEKDYLDLLNEYHSYDWVEEHRKKMNDVNQKLEKYNKLCKQLEDLEEFDLPQNDIDAQDIVQIDNVILNLDEVLLRIKKAEILIKTLNDLELVNLIDFNCDIEDLNSINTVISHVSELEKHFFDCSKRVEKFNQYNHLLETYDNLKNQGLSYSQDFKNVQSQLDEALEELNKYKQHLIDEKIMCEVCGSILS